MEEKKYEAIVEAILFTMGESVELERIAKTLELDTERTKKIIEHLMQRYEDDGVGVKIMELDGSYQMCTKGEMYEYLVKIAKQPKKHVLTDVLPGRPLLFGTTEEFLRSFGVQSIDELPVLSPVQVEEFKQEAEAEMHMKLDI